MNWLIDFLEKNMSKAVLVTTLSSLMQFLGYLTPGQNTPIPEEILKQVMASSSGIQSAMLIILYLYLKFRQEKK